MTAFALKMIAIGSMLIDHIGDIFGMYTPVFFRWIGRIAFPIFAYMIAQGCTHTKNIHNYLLRLGILALISEIPFDIAFHRRMTADGAYDLNINFLVYTNVFYTLFLGVACIAIYEGLKTKKRPWVALLPFVFVPVTFALNFIPYVLILVMILYTASALYFSHFLPDKDADSPIRAKHKIIAFLAAVPLLITAYAMNTDFGAFGVGLIFFLYLGNPDNKLTRAIILTAGLVYRYGLDLFDRHSAYMDGQFAEAQQILNYDRLWILLFSLIAVPLICLYNGKPGRKAKWAFYVFYPAHIAILMASWFVFLGV